MANVVICTRCGSREVVPRIRVVERGESNGRYDLQVEVCRRPNAVLFKGAERSNVYAQLCGACGHLELYADMPRAMYATYVQADSRSAVSVSDELERTREALADSQLQLHALEEKLAFLEQLLDGRPPLSLPKAQPEE